MPSPFPGMNPYMEEPLVFHDFHGLFAGLAKFQLAGQVRPKYVTRIDAEVVIREPPADARRVFRPDVYITESDERSTAGGAAVAGAKASGVAAPFLAKLPMFLDEEKLPFIEIRDREDRRLVTVVELVSPTNKADSRSAYLGKRQAYVAAGVNLVEIDLLRAGRHMPVEPAPRSDYLLVISRAGQYPDVHAYPFGIRDPFPIVPIPLLPGDPDVKLDLKRVLDEAYDRSDYPDTIYKRPPTPLLSPADQAWADQLLADAGIVRPTAPPRS